METNIEISNLVNPIINGITLINNEFKNLTEYGLANYLRIQTEKYYLSNNFLYPYEKVKFNDSYFHITASYRFLNTDFSNAEEIFSNYKNITLIGHAGSGKTTLIKYIFFQFIKKAQRIPVVIELRALNEYKSGFENFVFEKIINLNIKPSITTLKRALKNGNFIFLFDGFDEVYSHRRNELNQQLDIFFESYSENYFLITSRPGSGIERTNRFHDFRMNKLSQSDILQFINQFVTPIERRDNIIAAVNDRRNSSYKHYLTNPLLLSMFILAFNSHPEIPKRKSAFYRNVFDTLFSRHDGINKNSFPREKLTHLEREDFESILAIYSYISLMDGKFAFTEEYMVDTLKVVKEATEYKYIIKDFINDLEVALSIIYKDGFEYVFPHRSMQEYFAAKFIQSLPMKNKKNAYEKAIAKFDSISNDNGLNFYSLCLELDRISFIHLVTIPELMKIKEALDKKNMYELLLEFFKCTKSELRFGANGLNEFFEPNYTLLIDMQSNSLLYSLQNLIDIFDFEPIRNFPSDTGAMLDILTKFPDFQTKGVIPLDNQNNILYDILIEYNLPEHINKIKLMIVNKLKELQFEVLQEDSNLEKIIKI
jgi:hypothetical protein